jgi:glutamate synthase (ferredoxin)
MDAKQAKNALWNPFNKGSCGIGFLADLNGKPSHTIIREAFTILKNLQHRGACRLDSSVSDGCGILTQIPHEFLKKECANLSISLPDPKDYGTGLIFLPETNYDEAQTFIEELILKNRQIFLGWRDLPMRLTNSTATPVIKQLFIGRNPQFCRQEDFERKLYLIRKEIERHFLNTDLYIPSLSSHTIVYKGMLSCQQFEILFPDLEDPRFESALALVHQRFSTNTFPSWRLAHPFRYIAHNGEINTLRGNINWIKVREKLCQSPHFEEIESLFPIIQAGGSDSSAFDNVLEFLVMTGRSLPHALLMMIPEAWEKNAFVDEQLRAFYQYHQCLMEPWDGPAAIAFSDGTIIGAITDRNGLRPSRYWVTKQGLVVFASETGVLDIPPEDILMKKRLPPGHLFVVDTAQHRIIDDKELKHDLAAEYPYQKWLADHFTPLKNLPMKDLQSIEVDDIVQKQCLFGYTQEELRLILEPMALKGDEAIGSMGNDAALAVLSNKPRLLYDYFTQLFAQVTNPPLDSIREEIVTQMSTIIGPEHSMITPRPINCRRIQIDSPILTNLELNTLRHLKSATLKTVFSIETTMEDSLRLLFEEADQAIAKNTEFLILSDRGTDESHIPIPALLACSGLHHHLIEKGTRARVGLIVESGEPRETHHMALLIGYGADAINPYLAYATVNVWSSNSLVNYRKALEKGLLKIISKMGISTLQSYHGAQIFEAIGLDEKVIDTYFTDTASRISGIGLDEIEKECRLRHQKAYSGGVIEMGGDYQWRIDGEYHLFNPETIITLQMATRAGDYTQFKKYMKLVDDQTKQLATLRGLFELNLDPISIEEVESIDSIIKRFSTGAMSYGSISQEAHETLAIAMNRLGARSNTGEGGEDPARYNREKNGDSKNSAIKQVASGRFGVTSEYLVNATDLQIKIAQGSKPGEGGQIPGSKVYPWIAKVRYSVPGVGLISPPPHHDIYSIEDIAQLIFDLKNSNPLARIHVKLVAECGVGAVAAGVAKARADVVLISGYDGGTGASPLSSIKHSGIPWELGLAETQQTLIMQGLRDKIIVQVDGQMKTSRDVVIAALLGAEEYGFSTAPLAVLGCIMMRVCHLNTCPVGIATQDPELRKNFSGKPEYLINFFHYIAQGVRELMAELGFRTMDEMIGRTDKLRMKPGIDHWKAKGLDYTSILATPPAGHITRQTLPQEHDLHKTLDETQLIPDCLESIEKNKRVTRTYRIFNTNRTVGTRLGYEITKRYGGAGLPDDTIHLNFQGTAGQSFGAFLPSGLTLMLEGDANDYVGKGLSGGKIAVFPPKNATFKAHTNVLIGNVVLYGATSGEAYFAGMAGERFAVRNSGALAVVEGVGDHCCEYMTRGCVVVLGSTGRNFGAGMSGGVAYVLDEDGQFEKRCNLEMVSLAPTTEADRRDLQKLLKKHMDYTGSLRAEEILVHWDSFKDKFVKVIPKEIPTTFEKPANPEENELVSHGKTQRL